MITTAVQEALALGCEAAKEGHVATYIPELSKADPNAVGLFLRTLSGGEYSAGEVNTRFTIQSISKVITLAAAIDNCGADMAFSRVGMEPSGESFNSLVELDINSDLPYNPMINSGALTVASLMIPYMTFEDLLDYSRRLCLDPEMTMDRTVYESEMANVSRNRAISYLLESKGILENGVERSLMLYTKMCSMSVTAKSLANLGCVLANNGCDPETGKRLIQPRTVQIIKTIMLTCGMYDSSGTFAVRVGMPAKSGVGGGLLGVAGSMGIGIYGPSLDQKGNSIAGCRMLEHLSHRLGLHLFADSGEE